MCPYMFDGDNCQTLSGLPVCLTTGPVTRSSDHEDEYECAYNVTGLSQDIAGNAKGVDPIQSLLLALKSAAVRLVYSDEGKVGTITWLDEDIRENLGLPL